MKPGAGKSKGSAFERKIAKTLSSWITGGQSISELIRSVSSGGWTPRGAKEEWRQVGDLAPNGEAGAAFQRCWAVECKHHREVDVGWALWRNDGGIIGKWDKKLRREIRQRGHPGQQPLIIFRANRQRITVVLPWSVGGRIQALLADDALVVPWHGFALVYLDDVLALDPQLFMENAAA